MSKQFLYNDEFRIDAARQGDFESLVREVDRDYFDNLELASHDLPLLEDEDYEL